LGGVYPTGGSISRLQEDIYREAADLAYYFNWSRGDILGMTGQERKTWLGQIRRIHYEQKAVRDRELIEHSDFLINKRKEGLEQG
jgi:hypothetical protein